MRIGKTHKLKAARTTDNGCYLIDDQGTEVLLPNIYVNESLKQIKVIRVKRIFFIL